MNVGEICSRDVLTMSASEPLATCAKEMRDRNLGSVVIVDSRAGFPRPVGIITDRDVLRGQFARGADLFCLNTGDVMTNDPLVLREDTEVAEAIERMSRKAVRRAPVVGPAGALVGIVSFDDLVPAIAGQIATVAALLGGKVEQRRYRW